MRPNQVLLINEEALRDFYELKLKQFPNTGRELEV